MSKLTAVLLVLAPAAGVAAASRALPMWVGPTPWPVERMIENLERHVERHPDDPEAHFELGRVHSLAFTLEAQELGTRGETSPVQPVADHLQRWQFGQRKGERPGAAVMLAHVREGVRHLQTALEGMPHRPEAHLSLAYLVEGAAHLAPHFDTLDLFQLPPIRVPDETREALLQRIEALGSESRKERKKAMDELQERRFFLASLTHLHDATASSNRDRADAARELLRRFWIEEAIRHYRTATDLALPEDLKRESKPFVLMVGNGLDQLASYEAGRAWVRLVEERGPFDESERALLGETKAALKKLEDLPGNSAITPLLLTFTEHASLDELLLEDHAVAFDLDGDGLEELWPWVRPDVGFFVWDPAGEGRVRSGRELFGTASAQILFADGYRALGTLDDDGDGWIAGRELEGIGLWFDRDSDGLSDPGEVAPVVGFGVRRLRAEATGRVGGSLVSECGVEMEDGRWLASYDWVTRPFGVGP